MKERKQLITSVVIFLVALFGVRWYIDKRVDQVKDKRFVTVIRAKKDMDSGTVVSAGAIEAVTVPEQYAPKARIRWEDRDQYYQQPLASRVLAGDYLLETALDRSSTVGRTLSQQLEGEDYRAITLTVDETNSFSRSIVSGDRIDILFTFTVPPLKQKISTLLLQNISVISTGAYNAAAQELGEQGARGGKYNTITLKVTASDAIRLTYARQVGTINILLRSIRDNKTLTLTALSGVQDVLSASDKALVDGLLQQSQIKIDSYTNKGEAAIREQAKAAIEQQKKQLQ